MSGTFGTCKRSCRTLHHSVKDTQQNLPINPEKQKRARLIFVSSTPIPKAYKGDPVKQIVVEESEVERVLKKINPMELSPLDALSTIIELKKLCS